MNHELDETAIKVPRIREKKNKFRLGLELRIKERIPTVDVKLSLVLRAYKLLQEELVKRGL